MGGDKKCTQQPPTLSSAGELRWFLSSFFMSCSCCCLHCLKRLGCLEVPRVERWRRKPVWGSRFQGWEHQNNINPHFLVSVIQKIGWGFTKGYSCWGLERLVVWCAIIWRLWKDSQGKFDPLIWRPLWSDNRQEEPNLPGAVQSIRKFGDGVLRCWWCLYYGCPTSGFKALEFKKDGVGLRKMGGLKLVEELLGRIIPFRKYS